MTINMALREKHSVVHALLDVVSLGFDALQKKIIQIYYLWISVKLLIRYHTKYFFKN